MRLNRNTGKFLKTSLDSNQNRPTGESNAPRRVPLRLCATCLKIANNIIDSLPRYIQAQHYRGTDKQSLTNQLAQAPYDDITQPNNERQANQRLQRTTSRRVTQLTQKGSICLRSFFVPGKTDDYLSMCDEGGGCTRYIHIVSPIKEEQATPRVRSEKS